MSNQDLVALHLTRCLAEEMHQLVFDAGFNMPCTWGEYVHHGSTKKLLLSHGWTLKAYAAECNRKFCEYTFNDDHTYFYMIRCFAYMS